MRGFLAIGETPLVQSVPESSLWGASRGGVLEKVLLFDPRFVLHAVSHGYLSPFLPVEEAKWWVGSTKTVLLLTRE